MIRYGAAVAAGRYQATASGNRLHLGCGPKTPKGWLNVDGSWNARIAKHPMLRSLAARLGLAPAERFSIPWSSHILIHDVRKPLPFPDCSFSAIYASHLLEHLYLTQGKRLLEECFRVCEPGGVLRMVVPDLGAVVREYLGEATVLEPLERQHWRTPADRLNARLLLRDPEPPQGGIFYRIYTLTQDFHSHKWMYDAHSLSDAMRSAGFMDVTERKYLESRISGIEDVEEKHRVLNGVGICVEGVRQPNQ